MLQVVHVDFKSSSPHLVQKTFRGWISFFRHNLEGRLDSRRGVDIHQFCAKVTARQCLDIMRDNGAAWGTLRPKPDKRNFLDSVGFERNKEQRFHKTFYRAVHGPIREGNFTPTPEVESLDMPTDRYRQQRPDRIVAASNEGFQDGYRGSVWSVHDIPFATQVIDDLRRIKWQAEHRIFRRNFLQ